MQILSNTVRDRQGIKQAGYALLCTGLLLLGPREGISANAADATDESQKPQLDEIVVTAQKREETIDKVPISISVFNQAAMQQRNINDITDIAAVTPGIDYQNQGVVNSIAIRGVSSGIIGYSTTGIYIDDVPIQIRQDGGFVPTTNTEPKVFDLDRVEVLRGPQGTLFGAGAEGGAIRFIQPEPSLTEYSGYARAGAAVTDNGGPSYETGAAFGGPIIDDELGFRVSAWHRRDGGYIDHQSAIAGGASYQNAAWSDSDVLRAAVTFAPFDSLKITPSIYYQHQYFNDVPTFDPANSSAADDPFTRNWSSLGPQYTNIGAGRLINPGLLMEPSSDQFYLPSLKGDLHLAAVDLKSTTSYFYRRYTAEQDFTTVMPTFVGQPWPLTASGAAISTTPLNQNVFTQELRAQSTETTPLKWTFGVFYTSSRQADAQYLWSPDFPAQVLAGTGMPIASAFGQNLLPGGNSYIALEQIVDSQLATFGQVTYQLIDHLSLTAGVRVASVEDKYSIFQNGPLNGATSSNLAGEQSQHVVDPKIGIDYQVDDRNLLYVSAAKGDRIGGLNPPFLNNPACDTALNALGLPNGVPRTYSADSLWSFEIGSKNRLFDGRLQMETSVFHIDWSNIQQQVQVNVCTGSFTANLGKATSNGFDYQANALITDSFKLGLSLGYTNARDSSSLTAGGNPIVTRGQQVNPYAAPWIVVPTAEYDFDPIDGYKMYLRVDDTFHSKNPGPYQAESNPSNPAYNANFIPNPATNQLNAHLGATWDRWDVSLYALNVLNSHPLLYNQQLQSFTFYGSAFTIRPLTVGINSSYRW
jgi:iron complex outermembrane recepter protein